MTNYERWRLYTSGLISPDCFIDWGFYYLISASLQRRVWLPPEHAPIYPNIYVVLVADPSVGKGLVIRPVANILKSFKMLNPAERAKLNSGLSAAEKSVVEELEADDYKRAEAAFKKFEHGEKSKITEKPLVIPVAADSTTFEQLVRSLSKSIRHMNYKKFDDKAQKDTLGIYTHSSMAFCLEEISSLFRKRLEDTVRFLLVTYDCGDYEHETKTMGCDKVQRCCVNLIGGTTPGFMQECFDDKLLSEGFSSRTFFIFATQNRKTGFFIPPLSEEQIKARDEITKHVEKLTTLYGPLTIDKSTVDFLEDWIKQSVFKRANTSPKLDAYYGRKNLHVAKLAMALHFSESTDMHIKQESFERAIEICSKVEHNMHYSLGIEKNNPLAIPARKIIRYLELNNKKTKKELALEFWDMLPNPTKDLDEILEHLKGMGKLKSTQEENPLTGAPTTYYGIINSELNGGNKKDED